MTTGLGRSAWLLLALFCALIALGRPASFAAAPSRDMGQYLYVGTVILDGGAPYVDAANNKGPANFLLWSGIRLVAGQSSLIVRLLLVAAAALTALALATWVAHHAGRSAGLLAGVAYALLCSAYGFEGPDPNNAQFGVLPMVGALALATTGTRAGWGLAGASMAFAFWMNPAFAFAAPFVAWELWRGEPALRVRRLGSAMLGALAVTGVLLAWIGLTGGFDDMLIQVFGQAQRALSPDSAGSAIPPPSGGDAPLQFLLDLPDPLLWIAGLTGCVVAARDRRLRPVAIVSALWIVAWFVRVELASYAFPSQYVPALAGIASGIALGAASLWPTARGQRICLAAMLLAAPVWAAVLAPQLGQLGIPAGERGRSGTQPVVDFVREATVPGDHIVVAGYDPQIYWLADRRAPSRFFDAFGLSNRAEYVAERARDLEDTPPAAVVAMPDTLPDPELQALLDRDRYVVAYQELGARVWLRP